VEDRRNNLRRRGRRFQEKRELKRTVKLLKNVMTRLRRGGGRFQEGKTTIQAMSYQRPLKREMESEAEGQYFIREKKGFKGESRERGYPRSGQKGPEKKRDKSRALLRPTLSRTSGVPGRGGRILLRGMGDQGEGGGTMGCRKRGVERSPDSTTPHTSRKDTGRKLANAYSAFAEIFMGKERGP